MRSQDHSSAPAAAPQDQAVATPTAAAGKSKAKAAQGATFGKNKPRTWRRRFCCFFKWGLASSFLFLCLLGGALYYFIFTLSGARTALSLAQNVIPQNIIIDTTIEDGSVYSGLKLGKTLVDIKDVVAINADSLTLKYDLMQLQQKLFKVQTLESSNLVVSLSDAIFAPKAENPKPEDPNAPPFRLTFPVDIDIDRFFVDGFAFNSQIVDVSLDSLNAVLWAKSDNLGINGADVQSITVHLKNSKDVAAQQALAAAASQVDAALALKTAQGTVPLSDVEQAVEAVVLAAQQGTTVEVVTLNEEQQLAAQQPQQQAQGHGERGAHYTDPELFADAMERALLDDKDEPLPTFAQERIEIHEPVDTKLSNEEFEQRLLSHVQPVSNEQRGAATTVSTNATSTAATSNAVAGTSDVSTSTVSTAATTRPAAAGTATFATTRDAASAETKATAAQGAQGSAAEVKEFGSGNGAIATLPTVVLPFNAVVKDFVVTKGRYYMEGFDTQETDLALSATWYDTKLEVEKLTAKHELGAAEIAGFVNLDQYFDLNVSLNADGAQNDTTKNLFTGFLYGLKGQLTAQGNLTDLHVRSTLNLGGTTTLKARANVLSSALPVRVRLQSKDFSYPLFTAEPMVNLQHLDFQGAGNIIDGVNITLSSLVSGFELENVSTDLKAQVSYEKSHIERFVVDGIYQKEKLSANISGDVFYGSVLGVDAKVYAQMHDAGWLSPMLAGPLLVDGDVVAIMNQNEKGKTAVSTMSEPAYLANRIPKTSVGMDDFDPDTLEERLLAQVRTTGNATLYYSLESMGAMRTAAAIRNVSWALGDERPPRRSHRARGADGSSTATPATAATATGAGAAKNAQKEGDPQEQLQRLALQAQTGAESATASATAHAAAAQGSHAQQLSDLGLQAQGVNDETAVLSSMGYVGTTRHEATPEAVAAVSSGKKLAAVRPLLKTRTLAGGVPDEPTDVLISQDEYVNAVRLDHLTNQVDDQGQPTFLASIFNQDMPEVMVNVRYLKGELYFNGYETTIDSQNIIGNLQQGFRIDQLEVNQGNNAVIATGQVTEKGADLNAIIDIQDFTSLVPTVEGSLSAHLISSGSIHDLNFELSGSAPRIRSGAFVVRKLAFNSAFNMQTRALNFTALADRVRFAAGMAANRQCFIDLSGTPLRHSLSANCGGTTAAFLSVDGSLNLATRDYTANLMEMYLSTESAGSLSLANPVNVNINLNDMAGSMTPLELRGEIGQLYVAQTEFSPQHTQSHVSVSEFNLSSLSDFYPDSIKMQVPLNVEADILVQNGNPDITVDVSSDNGVIFSTVGAGIVYDGFTLSSHITRALMRTNMDMQLYQERGLITAQIDVIDPMGKGQLDGYYRIEDFDLATISNIGQSFTELTGKTNVDVTFGGDLTMPQVFGKIQAQGTAIPRYDVGQINDFDIALDLAGSQGNLDGKVVLNGEPLKLSGQLDWSNGANGSLLAQAQNMPVFLVGYGVARTNIDAQVTLGEVLDIKGDVQIPEANIQVQNVASSGVTVSGDEIIVPSEGTSALMGEAPSNFKSAMDLNVTLGDDVNFEAMGMVKGRLVGGIEITKAVTDEGMKANGEISVQDGTADVYGRKFSFSMARVLFFNDLTNPSLNVEILADREGLEDDVDVGIRVTGTATSPDINFFSKPSMSQNEILSYILYGHGLEKNVLNQDSTNSNMLLGLGMSGISSMMSSLASSFGMRNVQFNTQGSGDDTQVAVQGYINRRLRLSYGYGVFSAVGEFKVRYELIQNLYAEFVSSINQAVDLIYSFEFD